MRTVDIPGGQATLRGPDELRVRHRRLLETAGIAAAPAISKVRVDGTEAERLQALAAAEFTRQQADSMLELQDATIVAYLASWTLPIPLPTMDTVGDLPTDVYDVLAEVTRGDGADTTIRANFDPSPGEMSPTPPSADYGNGSKGAGELPSEKETTSSPSGGESTPTASSTVA